MIKYWADFETQVYNNKSVVKIACCLNEKEEYLIKDNLNDFFNELSNLSNNNILYFHNLSYDGKYIIDWLINLNYIHYNNFEKNKNNGKFFNLCMKDDDTIYKIDFRYNNARFRIYCSLRILGNMSIKTIGEIINLKKLQTNYDSFDINNKEDIEYVIRDCLIAKRYMCGDFMDGIKKTLNRESKKITIGGITNEILNFFYEKNIKNDRERNEKFTIDEWNWYKESYGGGITYANKSIVDKVVKNVYYYDINSSYPTRMIDYLPYRRTEKTMLRANQVYTFMLEIKRLKCNIKSWNTPNFLRVIKPNEQIHYFVEGEKDFTIKVWKEEWEVIKKFYDLEYKLIKKECWLMRKPYKEFVEFFYNLKQHEKNKGLKTLWKLFLNSASGKLGQSIYNDSAYLSSKDEAEFSKNLQPNQILVRERLNKYAHNHVYIVRELGKKITPVYQISYITAAARVALLNVIYVYKDNFCYCDTDSVILTCEIDKKYQDDNILGMWKQETIDNYKVFPFFKTLGRKKYAFFDENRKLIDYACCGCNCLPIDDINQFTKGYIVNKLAKLNLEEGWDLVKRIIHL